MYQLGHSSRAFEFELNHFHTIFDFPFSVTNFGYAHQHVLYYTDKDDAADRGVPSRSAERDSQSLGNAMRS